MSLLSIHSLRCEYQIKPLGLDVAQPRFSWQLHADRRGVLQQSYQIQVGYVGATDTLWDTGDVDCEQSQLVEYAGPPLLPRTAYWYRVCVRDDTGCLSPWSDYAQFETGLLQSKNWLATWIAPSEGTEACPYLRREFHLRAPVLSARVYVTAQGIYELRINGARVSDWLFTPGWTVYEQRLQYQTYDVTTHVAEGVGAIGILLGSGWYKGNLGWEGKRQHQDEPLAALLQLHVKYQDGTEEWLLSDADWRGSTGPIQLAELYHGERYDARLELTGWDLPGYDDTAWSAVRTLDTSKHHIVAQESEPVRVVEQLTPVAIITTPDGDRVLDMGQNMVGWIQFSVDLPSGAEVSLQHAEILDQAGRFYTGNLRTAQQTIHYTCKGGGRETFAPHFTFQGFRYVKLSGFPETIAVADFCGCVIHSDLQPTGEFSCSQPLLNQLQHNIVWGQKGNFLDIPTDCPQRDERLGWTGDAQVFVATASFNYHVARFFSKWLHDLRADQLPSGAVPHVIPNVLGEGSVASSAWADAAVICPWTIYQYYGDRRLLAQQYDSMKAWVDYMRAQGEQELLFNTGFHFGDWLALDAKPDSYFGATPTDLIATAFFAYSTKLLAQTAQLLGRSADASFYEAMQQRIVASFQAEFVTPAGRLAASTQTGHVLALVFDLLKEKDRPRIAKELVKLIADNDGHLTTGFVGAPYLCFALSRSGYHELACQLVQQTEYPSWLYSVTRGATTIWEHWDGIKQDGSFWSDDMNSFNHYAYGSIGDWLYREVAGIQPDPAGPGFQMVQIAPRLMPELTAARAALQTGYGQLVCSWTRLEDEGGLTIHVEIPCNVRAHVTLPYARLADVRESGVLLSEAAGVSACAQQDRGAAFMLGSGLYQFTYTVHESER